MMRYYLLLLITCLTIHNLKAQNYSSRSGSISFYSDAPMEKIEAHNKQMSVRLNTTSGDMNFAVLIKAFQFQKQLMHEHFNNDYLESQTYPKAVFQGQIMNINKFDLSRDGNYPVTVSGTLNLHGVTKRIMEKGTLRVTGGKITASSKFPITLADYNVKIPVILKDKIAKTVLVEINVDLKPE